MEKEITLNEVLSKKKELEQNIKDLLTKFDNETRLSVSGLEIWKTEVGSVDYLTEVKVEIKID